MTSRLLLARSFLALVHSMDLVLFLHSMDLQPFAMVLSKDLVLFVHSMDLQPFAMVLSKDLAQDDHEDLILQTTLKILYSRAVKSDTILACSNHCCYQVGLVLLLSPGISSDYLFLLQIPANHCGSYAIRKSFVVKSLFFIRTRDAPCLSAPCFLSCIKVS